MEKKSFHHKSLNANGFEIHGGPAFLLHSAGGLLHTPENNHHRHCGDR